MHVVIRQIIINIDQLPEFLSRDKDWYLHSVKSHLNVHSVALKPRNLYDNRSFRSKNLVYQAKTSRWQHQLTFHLVLFVNIHGTV